MIDPPLFTAFTKTAFPDDVIPGIGQSPVLVLFENNSNYFPFLALKPYLSIDDYPLSNWDTPDITNTIIRSLLLSD